MIAFYDAKNTINSRCPTINERQRTVYVVEYLVTLESPRKLKLLYADKHEYRLLELLSTHDARLSTNGTSVYPLTVIVSLCG